MGVKTRVSGQAGYAPWIHAGRVMNWSKTNGQRKEGGDCPAMGPSSPVWTPAGAIDYRRLAP